MVNQKTVTNGDFATVVAISDAKTVNCKKKKGNVSENNSQLRFHGSCLDQCPSFSRHFQKFVRKCLEKIENKYT